MHTIQSRAIGNFRAEPRFKKYRKLTEKLTKTRWKTTPKNEKWIWKKNNEEFLNFIIFSIEKRIYHKNAISKILCVFQDIDKNMMRKLLFFKGFSKWIF